MSFRASSLPLLYDATYEYAQGGRALIRNYEAESTKK